MPWSEQLTLLGNHCTLKPLHLDHLNPLIEAVSDGELWKIKYALVPHPDTMENEIKHRLALHDKNEMMPFTVFDNKTQKIVGMTSFARIDQENKRLDIGFTWYAKSHQRTALNTECKLVLLTHAFEQLNCIAVGFRVDFLNQASRMAVERLGAKLEGIIRNYGVMPNGHTRDMCFYSILPHEWPNVKSHLHYLLEKYSC